MLVGAVSQCRVGQWALTGAVHVSVCVQVASVFGDDNPSALTVTRIARGSVVYAFTNNTLSGSACPVDDITALADKLVTADGSLNPVSYTHLTLPTKVNV